MSIAIVKIFESAMNAPFDLSAMLDKINTHHICGNLTDTERNMLVNMARSAADPSGSLDVMEKLAEMEERIRKLEAYHAAPEGDAEDGNTEAVGQYIPGKWYRTGDKVAYDGKVYVCTVSDGAVCVWSPAEYPAYWEEQ